VRLLIAACADYSRLVKRRMPDENERVDNDASSGTTKPSDAEVPPALASDEVLRLQRSAGNHAVSTMLSGLVPGAEPSEEETEMIGGLPLARTFGEAVGDVARPLGVGLGNVVGGIAGALTGISISTTDNAGPTWNPNGSFTWDVGFTTTGTSGWIVQKINNNYRAENAAGPLGGPVPTPEFWEAWAVDAASVVTPGAGATNDMWRRPNRGAGTKGHWSLRGACHFTTTDPATQGFAAGNVPDAGVLLSSTAEPPGLGIARLHRYAQGTWDSTAGVAHAGSAGP
jgi:hypothetical protein